MPLYLTAAHSSRIQKPAHSSLRRHASSPFASAPRTKPVQRTKSFADVVEDGLDDSNDRLDATGKILSVLTVESAHDVLSAVRHTSNTMFCTLPDRAGMNSTRIAEVLNFQKSLPPLATLAHVHALISASSKTERQLSTLYAAGTVRKIKVTGRGNDISGTSELLITIDDLQDLLKASHVAQDIVSDFLDLLHQNPRAVSVFSSQLAPSHVAALVQAGFLVSSSITGTRNLSLSGSSLVAVSTISRAHSGTSAAIGGDAAFENLGGVGAAKRSGSHDKQRVQGSELALSVPNIGPYLRLLNAGRTHLLDLLGKSKYREAPLYLLRERWDGAVDSDSRVSNAKRVRGEFSVVMPAKTKKWKDLSGLNFDWALEECLGAGLIELFETRSVGLGVRALT